ncbi:TlpA family protein disulfide reductase [Marinisporobacter balticus]|uniref:Thiol-disulfide isomerase/thioredoxin n=1 Tax=Marinisporobacter balticus TaxID=2018667 RepID=A0A4R2LFK8_9FIRM|nr:TlpA disulfide reductase family protein [Marinisporobacter balticus]TCO78045.1 thiol-disulfide isomerase/thioredoxin [Marinisporobacter balticus]
MLKKILVTLLIGTVAFTTIGCGKSNSKAKEKQDVKIEKTNEEIALVEDLQSDTFKMNALGFSFVQPESWKDNEYIDGLVLGASEDKNDFFYGGVQLSFVPKETMAKMEIMMADNKQPSEEDSRKLQEEFMKLFNDFKPLVHFNIYKKDVLAKKSIASLSNLKNNVSLGEKDNLIYYLSYPNKEDLTELSVESQKMYDVLYSEIENVKTSVKIFKPILPKYAIKAINTFPPFHAQDINGNDVSNTIFSESKLTMINVWGTFCGPCINEMPDLQKLYDVVKKENVNIVGIIGDAEGNEQTAKDIITKTKVAYVNIVPNIVIQNAFLEDISAYPTSIFVDAKGNIVGDPIIGARSEKEYKEIIMKTLKIIGK